jgi:hypothetical protein
VSAKPDIVKSGIDLISLSYISDKSWHSLVECGYFSNKMPVRLRVRLRKKLSYCECKQLSDPIDMESLESICIYSFIVKTFTLFNLYRLIISFIILINPGKGVKNEIRRF